MVSFVGAAPAGTAVSQLAGALAERGHQVVLYQRRQANAPAAPDGVESVPLPAGPPTELTEPEAIRHVGEFAAELARALRRDRPDVVHSHYWLAGLATHLATRDSAIPVAHTFHQLQLLRDLRAPRGHAGSPDRSRAEWAIARHADRVIACTDAEQDCLIHGGVPRQRVTVVPIGVDSESLNPDGPADPRNRVFRLLLLGPCDQADVGIRALAALPDTELTVAVRGGQRPADRLDRRRLHRLAERLRVADRVSVAEASGGARRCALIRSADAVVLLGPPDELDDLTLEAMACGVPVVAEHGVGSEAIVDGVTGIHLPGRNPKALAKPLRELLANEPLRLGMGWAARDRAVNRYSWSRVATETARVYHGMLSGGHHDAYHARAS